MDGEEEERRTNNRQRAALTRTAPPFMRLCAVDVTSQLKRACQGKSCCTTTKVQHFCNLPSTDDPFQLVELPLSSHADLGRLSVSVQRFALTLCTLIYSHLSWRSIVAFLFDVSRAVFPPLFPPHLRHLFGVEGGSLRLANTHVWVS